MSPRVPCAPVARSSLDLTRRSLKSLLRGQDPTAGRLSVPPRGEAQSVKDMKRLLLLGLVSPLLCLGPVIASACSAAGNDPGPLKSGAGPSDPTVVGPNGDSTPDSLDFSDASVGVRDPNDDREVPVRPESCDQNGQNCTCLRLALIGTLESAATETDTLPFTDWLNGNSGGTARVTMVTSKPTLNAEFLANYDILLIANVNTWTFSSEEKAAVEKWVREQGGGIISLTGFTSEANEPAASSQLIEFSGVRYLAEVTTAKDGQSQPVYYRGGTDDVKQCLSRTAGSEAIITTPIQFPPQAGLTEKLTFQLDYVGAFMGWGVSAPEGATVLATDPTSDGVMAVARQVDKAGRVLAFGDEWVIFANQWQPQGEPHNKQQDQYNVCWVMPEGDTPGYFLSVAEIYQTKQFWYNAIRWVAPPNECDFIIEDPEVVMVR